MYNRFHRVVALLAVVVMVCGAVPAFSAIKKGGRKKAQSREAKAQPKQIQNRTQTEDAQTLYQRGAAYSIQQNFVEAAKCFLEAARQGYAPAQFQLGQMYEDGRGVVQDSVEAVRWYRMAAEQGDAQAQSYLGMMYYYGEGVKQNYSEAAKWYLKSAEQGDDVHYETLGDMYFEGLGVRQNYAEAVKWYRKATEYKGPVLDPDEPHRVKEKLEIAQVYLDAANESYPSHSQTRQVAYDVPNLLDFGSGVLRFIQKGAGDEGIHRYYNYRCNIGNDGGIAERFVNAITSAYPFMVIKHYSTESKYGSSEIWALQYTGNKQARTYRRTFGKDKTVYQCHVTISKRKNRRDSFVSFSVGVSNELSYGGDTSSAGGAYANSNVTSSGSSSFSSSWQPTVRRERCTACLGSGTIRCDRCNDGYIYSKKVPSPPSFTGIGSSSSSEWQLCNKCHGSRKMKCNFCDGNGYVDRYY